MKTLATSLFFSSLLLSGAAEAQTKPAARPATKMGTASAQSTTRPVAKVSPAKAAPVAKVTAPAPTAAASTEAPKTVVAAAPKAASAAGGFSKGSTAVNLGVGLGLGYGYLGNASLPALNLSVERGIIENIGPGTIAIGGMVGYKAYRYNYGSTDYKATWTDIYVAARGIYHYNITENPKVDTYAGISLGLRLESYKDTYYGKEYSTNYGGAYAHSGIFLGGRYYFTDKVGAFAEAGYDMSYLKLGVTAKF